MPVNIVKSSGTFTPKGYSEKGTFLPVLLADDTEVTGLTYTTQSGYWTRSNNIVHLTFAIICGGIDLTQYSGSIIGIGGIGSAPTPKDQDNTGTISITTYDSITKRSIFLKAFSNKLVVMNDGLDSVKFNQLSTMDFTNRDFYLCGGITYNLDGEYEFTKEDVVNLIYPINSIYTSTVNTNPGILFPGTIWQEYVNPNDNSFHHEFSYSQYEGTTLFDIINWGDMAGKGVVNTNLNGYEYAEVYFTGQGSTNATNQILKIDLNKPFSSPITIDEVNYLYGASMTYPDIQLLESLDKDPGIFWIGCIVSEDKTKIWIGDVGYFVIPNGTLSFHTATYSRVSKLVGWKKVTHTETLSYEYKDDLYRWKRLS